MSPQSFRNMFAVVAIGAVTLGATLAPTGALAFGRLGGGHFAGGHLGGGHLGGRNWGHSPIGTSHPGNFVRNWPRPNPYPHPHPWPHPHPHPWPIHCHGLHCGHWPYHGIGRPYDGVEDGTVVQSEPPVQPVATCPAQVADGSFISVAFVPTATAADITSFLQSYEADITYGPDADGIYRVKISPETLSQADLENLIASIKAQTAIVRYVAA